MEQPIRFPGQYADPETGYYHNFHRDYAPDLGRYIQSDPRGILLDFSDPQRQVAHQLGIPIAYRNFKGLNHLYGYANQSPLIYTDATGELANIFTGLGFGLLNMSWQMRGTSAYQLVMRLWLDLLEALLEASL